MYLRRIMLNNIRDFSDFEVDFENPEDKSARLWTLLVGGNGVGKTTLLRAVALGFASEADANAMIASPLARMINDQNRPASIHLEISEKRGDKNFEILETIIDWVDDHEAVRTIRKLPSWASKAFVAGYGVARIRTGRDSVRPRRLIDSAETLFFYDSLLTPVELTMRRLQDFVGTEKYDLAMRNLIEALDLPPHTEISFPAGGGVEIRSGPDRAPHRLEHWADGYRLNFTWIADFFGAAMAADALTRDGTLRGLLLLDEIEQHTHPNIQDTLVIELKKLWPELQVIATTHSPLVVLGTDPSELVVLKRDHLGKVNAELGPSSFVGFTAEDILTDKAIFDTDARSVSDKAMLDQYKKLTERDDDDLQPDERKELAQLSSRLRGLTGRSPPDGQAASHRPVDEDEANLVNDLKALREKYGL
ncbi:MAG: hypothetical protein EOS54_23045 [Mesorhizobium sp.]|uniref:AAA family ATPase n=1 Tax=Mesorhizobium sp. TaxID=1871066 RepID=UPI000FE65D10|nr:AAA family ATPase [Mesorhizobium sp.]RWC48595.1 MAG: hypothetical protein EOS54_23045 [Mesorhizobium sp.]